jgi:hypothetical protein
MMLNDFNQFVNEAKEAEACPRAAKDLKLNTKNRNRAIKAEHIHYGPLNLSDKGYWKHIAGTPPQLLLKSLSVEIVQHLTSHLEWRNACPES